MRSCSTWNACSHTSSSPPRAAAIRISNPSWLHPYCERSVQLTAVASTLPAGATPRHAGPAPATGCRREHTSCRRRALSCCRRPVSRSHRRGPARGVLRARLAGRVTARPSAEAKPRRGGGRRREPLTFVAHAAGAVPAPERRGAVGPAEARRSHEPTADKPASASRSNARSAARLPPSPGLVCCIARLNGGARLREKARPPTAVAPEPDPQESRRDVGRASILAALARHGGHLCRSRRARPRPGARGAHRPGRPCTARDKDAGVRVPPPWRPAPHASTVPLLELP